MLIPDHWLPFVLIGRARRWSVTTVALASGLAAVIHVSLSLVLGLLAVAVGVAAMRSVGEALEHAGAAVLVLFGLGYALWAWTKGGHFHPGGAWLHRGTTDRPCAGTEGPYHPEHLHYHADGEWIGGRGQAWSVVGLAVVVGINPCILLMPVLLAGVPQGTTAVALAALAYAAPAVLLMVGLSVLGVRVAWRIRLPGAARYAEAASGLLIALLGAALWIWHD
jgi:hypothetical protein